MSLPSSRSATPMCRVPGSMARILSIILVILFWGGREPGGAPPPVKLIIDFINGCGSEGHGFKHPDVVRILSLLFFPRLRFRILGVQFGIEFRIISGDLFGQIALVLARLATEKFFQLLDRVLGEVESLSETDSLNLGLEGGEAARATRGMQSFDGQKIGPVSLDPSRDDSQRLFQLLLGPSPFEDLHSPVFKLISLEHRHSQIPRSGIDGQDRLRVVSHVVGLNN